MGQNIEREARENIRREVEPHTGANVQFFRTDKGDAVRAVIQYRGKSREVRFWRMSNQRSAMQSIISDTRRQMRDLGIIDRDKGRAPIRANQVGAIGDKLLEAVKKAAPHAFPLPPPPPPEAEAEEDYDDALPQADFLCPDAIAERARPIRQESRPMTPADIAPEPPHSNGQIATTGAILKHKLTKQETVTLTRLLLKVGSADEAAGLYTYNEGWSDERVHKELGTKANVGVVSDTRRDCGFGKLASEIRVSKAASSDAARIEALEARVAKLEEQIRILVG